MREYFIFEPEIDHMPIYLWRNAATAVIVQAENVESAFDVYFRDRVLADDYFKELVYGLDREDSLLGILSDFDESELDAFCGEEADTVRGLISQQGNRSLADLADVYPLSYELMFRIFKSFYASRNVQVFGLNDLRRLS